MSISSFSGVAIHFTGGKQASKDPTSAAQYDRVIPLGPKIGSELLRYVEEGDRLRL